MIYFLYLLFGFLGGVIGGMGMGGGTLLIPLLIILLDMEQSLSQGINLLSFLIMALFSLYIHFKHGFIDIKIAWPLIVGGVLFSVLGALIAVNLEGQVLKLIFGLFLVVLGVVQLIKIAISESKKHINIKKK